MVDTGTDRGFGDDIMASDHKRKCQGREYHCSCGYDEAKDEEVVRLRSLVSKLTNTTAVSACMGDPNATTDLVPGLYWVSDGKGPPTVAEWGERKNGRMTWRLIGTALLVYPSSEIIKYVFGPLNLPAGWPLEGYPAQANAIGLPVGTEAWLDAALPVTPALDLAADLLSMRYELEHLRERYRRVAAALDVCDGGRYLNDILCQIEKLKRDAKRDGKHPTDG